MSRNLNNITQNNGYSVIGPKIKKYWSDQYKASTNQGSGDMGQIIPVYWREMIPGEKLNLEHEIAIQFTPFVSTVMQEIKGEIMDFFVPYRICAFLRSVEEIDGDTYEEADEIKWENYITGGKNGQDNQKLENFSPQHTKYMFEHNNVKITHTLLDYFYNLQNVEAKSTPDEDEIKINALKINAYNLIYNECLRNPDITPFKRMKITNSNDYTQYLDKFSTATGYWLNDRFTRARKYQIRGIAPEIPITADAFSDYVKWETAKGTTGTESDILWTNTISTTGTTTPLGDKSVPLAITDAETKTLTLGLQGATSELTPAISPVNTLSQTPVAGFAGQPLEIKASFEIPAINATLNYIDFLYNLATLKYMANNARMKPRYPEFLKERYGIIPQDSRFIIPEWINSTDFDITIDAVTQTGGGAESATPANNQGYITSQGWGAGRSKDKTIYEAKEHGILISLLIIRPSNVYEGGLEKIDRADRTRFSFPIPEFMDLPDEEIKSSELYFTATPEDDDYPFGWEQIFDYYRTETNRICGILRPSDEAGLASYTLARSFGNAQTLNDTFLLCKPETNRIKQYTTQPDFIFFHRDKINEAIPLPIINNPIGT